MRIIYVIFIIFIFLIGNCVNKEKKLDYDDKNALLHSGDTIPKLTPLLQQYKNALNQSDSNLIKGSFNELFDSINALSYTKPATDYQQLVVYCKLSKMAVDSTRHSTFKEGLIKQKGAWLQYLIFLLYELNDNEGLIEMFNELNIEENKRHISPSNFLQRLIDVGVAYNKISDELQTERVYKEANQLAKKIKNQFFIAKTTINLNIYLFQKKLYDSVIVSSKQILKYQIPQYIKSRIASDLCNAYFYKGDSVQYNNYGNLELQYLTSIPKEEQPEDYQERLANAFLNKARRVKSNIALKDSLFKKAVSLLKKEFNNKGRELAKLYFEIANYKIENQLSSIPFTPIEYYNLGLTMLVPKLNGENDSFLAPSEKDIYAENAFVELCDAKADYLMSKNQLYNEVQLEKILKLYEVSFLAEKKLVFNFVNENSKIDYLNSNRTRTVKCLDICYSLYQKTNKINWIEKGLQFMENNKSYVLLESLQKNNFLNETLQNDIDYKEYKKLKRQLGKIYENQSAIGAMYTDSAVNDLKDKIEAKEYQIEKKHPQFIEIQKNVIPDVSFKKISTDFINQKTACINYFYNDSILYSISFSKSKTNFEKTNLSVSLVNDYKKASQNIRLQLNDPDSFIDLGNRLFHKLIPQNKIDEGIENVIIAPDANLFNISFASLITKRSNNTNYKLQHYLINEVNINYVFSLSSLYFNRKKTTDEFKILATAPFCNSGNNKPVLSHSKLEVEEISKHISGSKILLDKEATRLNFTNLEPSYNILHIASHSNYDTTTEISYIDFYDSTLSTNYFYNTPSFQVKLFFLSACETNVGKQAGGEGVLSLARSVYYAGAQNVISTNWQINDKATAAIVKSFYKNMKQGFSVSLQKAQREYIQQADVANAAPYYWASYSLMGAPKLSHSNIKYYFIGLSSLVLILSMIVYLKKRRKNT